MADSNLPQITYDKKISKRFRGYYPVIIDVETGGVNAKTDALLELAAVTINIDDKGNYYPAETIHHHIEPFKSAKIDPKSLEINKIDPSHPFRFAVSEKQALEELFNFLKKIIKQIDCKRCLLVGHNAWFDLSFLNAAITRTEIKKSPFHQFTSLDTASLGAIIYGHTVLAQILKNAKIEFDSSKHHSAIYDAEKTAELFCQMVNLHKI